jgi:hypothetical protein
MNAGRDQGAEKSVVYEINAELYGATPIAHKPKLLDLVSQASRFKRSSMRTEGADANWI